jgi:hypothetical protein
VPTSRLCRLERGFPCGVRDPGGRGRHNHRVPRKARPRTSRTVRRCAPPQSALQRRSPAPASLGAGEGGSAGAAGLCRPADPHPLTSQAIQHQGRHNQEVGIVGVMPTSALRRIRHVRRTSRFRARLGVMRARHNDRGSGLSVSRISGGEVYVRTLLDLADVVGRPPAKLIVDSPKTAMLTCWIQPLALSRGGAGTSARRASACGLSGLDLSRRR